MLKMELEQSNIPLAGDILDDLAMAFRQIIAKVSWLSACSWVEVMHIQTVKMKFDHFKDQWHGVSGWSLLLCEANGPQNAVGIGKKFVTM